MTALKRAKSVDCAEYWQPAGDCQCDEAIERYRLAFALAVQIEATPSALEALAGLADISADLEQAVQWLGLILNHAALSEETRKMAETTLDEIRTHAGLSPDFIDRQLEAGKSQRLEAIALVLAV